MDYGLPPNEYFPALAKVKVILMFIYTVAYFPAHSGRTGRRAVRRLRPGPPRMVPPSIHHEDSMSAMPDPDMKPGDEAEPGTPGAGEDLCETCGGSGKLADGKTCPECEGTGRVMRGIGGG
jgi:hypothetical protein